MNKRPRRISLTEIQLEELIKLRNSGPKPYLRERAAAILKIADGTTATQVARSGLLKVRRYITVLEWLNRYEQGGIDGLKIKSGRGRKPAFSPCL